MLSKEYNKFLNYCEQCPFGSTGVHPNCECSDGGLFNGYYCKNCPFGSTGPYGNCNCEGNQSYDENRNGCYECPSNR